MKDEYGARLHTDNVCGLASELDLLVREEAYDDALDCLWDIIRAARPLMDTLEELAQEQLKK